jgi:hypothetical protein
MSQFFSTMWRHTNEATFGGPVWPTFALVDFSLMKNWCHIFKYNDIQYKATQHYWLNCDTRHKHLISLFSKTLFLLFWVSLRWLSLVWVSWRRKKWLWPSSPGSWGRGWWRTPHRGPPERRPTISSRCKIWKVGYDNWWAMHKKSIVVQNKSNLLLNYYFQHMGITIIYNLIILIKWKTMYDR